MWKQAKIWWANFPRAWKSNAQFVYQMAVTLHWNAITFFIGNVFPIGKRETNFVLSVGKKLYFLEIHNFLIII